MAHAIKDTGLLIDGHDIGRADALAQARERLVAHGMTPAQADDATVDHPWAIARAFWLDDERGFGQEHHDGATPMTVVHMPFPSGSWP